VFLPDLIYGAGWSPRQASHFHLSRQMKVTKAKALFICHSCVAARVRLIHAMPKRQAEHLLRSEIAPMRSEARQGELRSNDRIALGPLVSRRGAQGFAGARAARFVV
jgi:hypothetical protein